jgi:methylated-DNA-[protein]-cysteine S-methyltransferase
MRLFYNVINSPVGNLVLVASELALCAVFWENETGKRIKIVEELIMKKTPLLKETEKQLEEYFRKKRTIFNIPIKLKGTPFQESVWQALLKIPYGQTKSYKEQASLISSKSYYRAVGAANGKNPISIIVPCHRVIGSNGRLTGFGGGLEAKRALLELESSIWVC